MKELGKRPEGAGTLCPEEGCCEQEIFFFFFWPLNIRAVSLGKEGCEKGDGYCGGAIWLSWANDGGWGWGWGKGGPCKGVSRGGF